MPIKTINSRERVKTAKINILRLSISCVSLRKIFAVLIL